MSTTTRPNTSLIGRWFVYVSLIALLVGLAGPALAAKPIVELTVNESAGVARDNEPVTMGVPLAQGVCDDAAKLVLLADGKPVAAQITEAARWLDGKSVKWVHVTWNQSLQAKGKATLTLAIDDAPAAPAKSKLSATSADGKVTVQTGYVKFVVGGAGFKGIEQAWFDPTGGNQFDAAQPVIVAGDRPGSVVLSPDNSQIKVENEAFKVDGQPKAYTSAADGQAKVEIEEQGPARVVVKATGRHLNGEAKALDYIVRYYAYADSPVVRVSHTFVCAQGSKPADHLFLAGLSMPIGTTLGGGKATFGGEKGSVSTGAQGRIFQSTSDSFAIRAGDKEIASGKGKTTKPLTTGWVDLSKDGRGLAVGVKWFWQMFPKALTVADDGTVTVELYPADAEQPLEAYMGQSRTHYLTLLFHDGKTGPEKLNAVFAGQNRPLHAWASPKYYCREAMPFGPMAENDPALFGDKWANVEKLNDVMFQSLKMLLAKLDDNEYNGIRRDSYGVYAWGDRFHWGWPKIDKSPYDVKQWRESWAGNYYDHPYSQLLQFLRTGEELFLDRYWPNAIQIGDVHTCNYNPNANLVGACRYCPPRNFVAVDNGTPYVSNEFNHYKAQSVFANWYLTGDRRSMDHCVMLANNALNNRAADSGWAARGIGAQMAGLWCAYELWREPKYLDRLKGLAGRAMAQFKRGKYSNGGDFMWGIANEGLVYYYWVSGDGEVIEVLKAGLANCKAKTSYANMAISLAQVYQATGDAQYAEWAWKALARHAPSSRVHGPGTQYRGNANALFLLSNQNKNWKPQSAPAGK